MARSPITGMVEQYQSLTPEEQKVFLDLVDPQPDPEPAKKQTRQKRGSRSPRAQSISNAIKPATGKPSDAPLLSGNDEGADGESEALCGACGHIASYQDHFKPSPNYHEFDAPKTKKAGAQK